MGFYIRKSVSAGPFRFNLSKSGLGMSVGVRGLRVGTGPRGNYIHMGRGGLYYRASLNPPRARQAHLPKPPPQRQQRTDVQMQAVEAGNVLAMVPSNGSAIVDEINQKNALVRSWPLLLGLGLIVTAIIAGQPQGNGFAGPLLLVVFALTALAAYWDKQRKTVVILYELENNSEKAFAAFSQAFKAVASAHRIWNIDTAGFTSDWKRNAGASRLVDRKPARMTYRAPAVVKTNVSVPAILGGKRNIYFFPDVALVTEGKRVGAISYDQLNVLWSDSIFVESDKVPADANVIGYSWQYANKNGGPDRRFNNNRQIPTVRYQQMSLEDGGRFQKVLQLSKNCDRSDFDFALKSLAIQVRELKAIAQKSEAPALGGTSMQGALGSA